MSTSRPSRPTTPLRRISSHSLRSLSLSHSQSRDPLSSSESPLSHLSPLFAELADSISDFCANAEQLSHLTHNLNRFNQGFSSYLYGLRTNSYTFDFNNLPDKINFDLAIERKQSHFLHQQQQQQQVQLQSQYSPPSSPSQDDRLTTGTTSHVGDSTFVTNDEQSFTQDHPPRSTSSASGRGGRGGSGSGIARGRGRGRGGGSGGVVTKRKKEEISAFADPVFPLLPINLRENRRTECEKVLWALKEHPSGIGLGDLTKHLSTFPSVPQVRINEVLLALVRAKVATKSLVKGLNVYQLDESRFSG